MSYQSNLDRFHESQYQNIIRLFDADDEAYERLCLNMLADPTLSLHKRTTCCWMIVHNFEHHDFYFQQGLETLQKVETLIDEGRVGERLRPWVADFKQSFENLRVEVEKALEEQETEDEVDAAGPEAETEAEAEAEQKR